METANEKPPGRGSIVGDSTDQWSAIQGDSEVEVSGAGLPQCYGPWEESGSLF